MKEAGYGPDKRLKIKVSTRNIATFRDPAVILIDQLKQIYDRRRARGDRHRRSTTTASSRRTTSWRSTSPAARSTIPTSRFFEGYACGSLRNYNGYCNPEMTKLFEAQSRELDQEKRLKMVWEIDRKLQEDVARPIIAYGRAAGCWQPHVKNVTLSRPTASTTAGASRTSGSTANLRPPPSA